MRVLVTGGAGFIGSHVVDFLLEQGHVVAVVDNLSTGMRANLNPRARFYELDIASEALAEVFALEKPEVVNHHAAQINVRASVEDPLFDAEVNIRGSLNLLQQCVKHGVRKVVYISSGGAIYGEPRYLPVDEEHPLFPLSPYGVSKHTVEHYLYLYRENYGLDYTVLRYPNVYGPRQNPLGEAGVVAIFTYQMLGDEPVVINGSGEQERDFLYVGDVLEPNLWAQEKGSGEAFNLGWGEGVSVNAVFVGLARECGYHRAPLYGPAKVGETFRIYLAAQKAASELGWRPRVRLEEGLRRTVASFRALEAGVKKGGA